MEEKISKLIELLKSCNKEDFNVVELEILEFNIDTIFEEISNEDLSKDNKYQLEHLYNNAKESINKQINSLTTIDR